jgi:hypothetical protein
VRRARRRRDWIGLAAGMAAPAPIGVAPARRADLHPASRPIKHCTNELPSRRSVRRLCSLWQCPGRGCKCTHLLLLPLHATAASCESSPPPPPPPHHRRPQSQHHLNTTPTFTSTQPSQPRPVVQHVQTFAPARALGSSSSSTRASTFRVCGSRSRSPRCAASDRFGRPAGLALLAQRHSGVRDQGDTSRVPKFLLPSPA